MEEQVKSEQQPKKGRDVKDFIFLGCFLLILVVLAVALYSQLHKPDSQEYLITQKGSATNDGSSPPEESINNAYQKLVKGSDVSLRIEDPDLKADQGFFILTSILSQQKDRVVYAEITECVFLSGSERSCSWEYKIKVKNVLTGKEVTIFKDSRSVSTKNRPAFINEAQAGGCYPFKVPQAWTKNDKKIILVVDNLFCDANWFTEFQLSTIDPVDGSINDLVRTDRNYVIVPGNEYVIYPIEKPGGPIYCDYAPILHSNSGVVVIENLETSERISVLNDPNTQYEITNYLLSNQQILRYTKFTFEDDDGCVGQTKSPEEVGYHFVYDKSTGEIRDGGAWDYREQEQKTPFHYSDTFWWYGTLTLEGYIEIVSKPCGFATEECYVEIARLIITGSDNDQIYDYLPKQPHNSPPWSGPNTVGLGCYESESNRIYSDNYGDDETYNNVISGSDLQKLISSTPENTVKMKLTSPIMIEGDRGIGDCYSSFRYFEVQ